MYFRVISATIRSRLALSGRSLFSVTMLLSRSLIDLEIVSALLEGDAEDLLRLLFGSGTYVGVDFDYIVAALAL